MAKVARGYRAGPAQGKCDGCPWTAAPGRDDYVTDQVLDHLRETAHPVRVTTVAHVIYEPPAAGMRYG